ncbi:hypothetical protein [Clostridium sp.]|uniref:hypothetical protein n=1 Tax=Clostridium sp. TaxID=1506 RepID=UPI003990E35F
MNSSESNSRVSRVQRHQKSNRLRNYNKKNSASPLKVLGVVITLAIVIYLIINCSNTFSTKVYASPLPTSNNTIEKLNGPNPVYKNYSPPDLDSVSGYMKEQAHILKNIERFDVNTAISMNYYDIVNLYPDSVNSANAFRNNFLKYSNVLSLSQRSEEEPIVNEICSDNNAFIKAIINYNSLLHSGGTYSQIIQGQNVIQNTFQNVTNLINQNINLF